MIGRKKIALSKTRGANVKANRYVPLLGVSRIPFSVPGCNRAQDPVRDKEVEEKKSGGRMEGTLIPSV